MGDEEVAALVVDNGSGMCKAGFAGETRDGGCPKGNEQINKPCPQTSQSSCQPTRAPVDKFALLGLPRSFDVSDVGAALRSQQRLWHPDRLRSLLETPQGRAQVQEACELAGVLQPGDANGNAVAVSPEVLSAAINEAAETLRCPLKRAVHLLELDGEDALPESQRLDDEHLLMQLFEQHSAIEGCSSRRKLLELRADAAKQVAVETDRLAAALKSGDRKAACSQCARLQLQQRVLEAANLADERLEPDEESRS